MRIIAGYGTCIGSPAPITKGRNSISSALSSSIQPSPALMRGFHSPIGRMPFTSRPPTGKVRRIVPSMRRALWLRGEDAASLRELEEAVALSPNFASGYYAISFVQAQTGDAQAAIEATDITCDLSPFDPMMYAICAARACALFRLGRYEEAADWALRSGRQPNAHAYAHALSVLMLAAAGHLDEARCGMRLVHSLRPGLSIDDVLSSFRLLKDQDRAFRSIAKQIGMG